VKFTLGKILLEHGNGNYETLIQISRQWTQIKYLCVERLWILGLKVWYIMSDIKNWEKI
jgi:hypothetical protein